MSAIEGPRKPSAPGQSGAKKGFLPANDNKKSLLPRKPFFSQKLADKSTLAGEEALLECTVSGFPFPATFWEKDGKAISNKRLLDVQRKGQTCSIRVKSCNPSLGGKYTCFAENILGQIKTEAILTVVVSSPSPAPQEPHSSCPRRHFNGTRTSKNKPLSSSSSRTPVPVPSTEAGKCNRIKRKGKTMLTGAKVFNDLLESPSSSHPSSSAPSSSRSAKNLGGSERNEPEDEGEDRDEDGDEDGEDARNGFPEEAGKVIEKLVEKDGRLNPRVMNGPKRDVKTNHSPSSDAAPSWGLRDENQKNQINSSSLATGFNPSTPRFVVKPRNQICKKGSTVKWTLSILDNPEPSISWYKLRGQMKVKIDTIDPKYAVGWGYGAPTDPTAESLPLEITFGINAVKESDAGKYAFSLETSGSPIESEVRLSVQRSLGMKRDTNNNNLVADEPVAIPSRLPAPVATTMSRSDLEPNSRLGADGAKREAEVVVISPLEPCLDVNLGDKVSLSTLIAVSPEKGFTVTWTQDGVELIPGQYIKLGATRVHPNDCRHQLTLVINGLREEHLGQYCCQVISTLKTINQNTSGGCGGDAAGSSSSSTASSPSSSSSSWCLLRLRAVNERGGGCNLINDTSRALIGYELIATDLSAKLLSGLTSPAATPALPSPEVASDPSTQRKPLQRIPPSSEPLIEKGPESVTLLRGQDISLSARFNGSVDVNITWSRRGKVLTEAEDKRISVSADPETSSCRLIIREAMADDSGKYIVKVEDEGRSETAFASVSVQGAPDPPSGQPHVRDLTDESLVVTWTGSAYDGGSVITGYVVEMAGCPEEGEEEKEGAEREWTQVSGSCHSTSFKVNHLVANKKYKFRIRAVNALGCSQPGKVSEPVRLALDKPNGNLAAEEDAEENEEEGVGGLMEIIDSKFKSEFEHRVVTVEAGSKFKQLYEIKEEVGRGKFGTVFRCSHKERKTQRAAKIIRCITAKDKEGVRQEIEIMNKLRHPRLLQLAAAYENPKDTVLIMEYISGGELFERIVADDFVLTERDCILFMRQICEGVNYMHENNVIHLDLKPENILCKTRKSHMVKIIDYGLARFYDPTTPLKVLFGTPEFVAPEIIQYEPVTPQSDLWSIGVIAYVLLSGLSPFMGDSDMETFSNVSQVNYGFDEEAFENVSEDAKDFIESLLVKRPEKRMTSSACLTHRWLSKDEKQLITTSVIQLSTDKLKKFIIRRKWQKTGTALRALGRMAGLIGGHRGSSPASSGPNSAASSPPNPSSSSS